MHTPAQILEQLARAAQRLYSNDEITRTIEILELLLELSPHDAYHWCMLGVCHRRLKQLPRALLAFQHATTLDPDYDLALVNLGECLCEARRPREGISTLRTVFERLHLPNTPPERQPVLVQRAGASLEAIQQSLRTWCAHNRKAG